MNGLMEQLLEDVEATYVSPTPEAMFSIINNLTDEHLTHINNYIQALNWQKQRICEKNKHMILDGLGTTYQIQPGNRELNIGQTVTAIIYRLDYAAEIAIAYTVIRKYTNYYTNYELQASSVNKVSNLPIGWYNFPFETLIVVNYINCFGGPHSSSGKIELYKN